MIEVYLPQESKWNILKFIIHNYGGRTKFALQ